MCYHENNKCQNVTVTLFVVKVIWSARRVCQTHPSLTLPCILAVCCEPKLLLKFHHLCSMQCQWDKPAATFDCPLHQATWIKACRNLLGSLWKETNDNWFFLLLTCTVKGQMKPRDHLLQCWITLQFPINLPLGLRIQEHHVIKSCCWSNKPWCLDLDLATQNQNDRKLNPKATIRSL